MKLWKWSAISVLGGLMANPLAAVEEPEYQILEKSDKFELRCYAPQVVATTRIEAGFESAGNRAFGRLLGYISGRNTNREEIAMTAPVTQESGPGEKIAMTAPVTQVENDGVWEVSFVMPAEYTLETLPRPNDPRIELRELPARLVAALRYSGSWSERRFRKHVDQLNGLLPAKQLVADGEVVLARYNAPFVPWPFRRNEVLLPVRMGEQLAGCDLPLTASNAF